MARLGLPVLTPSDNALPKKVIGYISVRGKASVFGDEKPRILKDAKLYHGEKKNWESTRKVLDRHRFEIFCGKRTWAFRDRPP